MSVKPLKVHEIMGYEEDLRETETCYRTLLKSIDQGFCVVEMIFDDDQRPVDYRFLEVNPVFEKVTGITNDKAADGKTARQLVPDLEEKSVEIYGTVALTGESLRFVEESTASARWFDVYAFRIGGHESRKVGIFFNDITERNRAEQSLAESEKKYRILIEQASDGIHTYDLEGNFIETNSKLCEMLGYTPEELLRLNVKDLVPPEDLITNPIRFDELHAGRSLINERRLLRKDGTLLPVEISGKMIEDGLLQAIIRDITERKNAEARLRQNEERLRAIFETSHDGILVEENERIIYVNNSYLRLFGYDAPQELIGKHISTVISERDAKRLMEFGRGRLNCQAAPSKYEFKGRRKDGGLVEVEASVSTSKVGGSIFITTIIRDISKAKQAAEQLRRSHEELEIRVQERTRELEAVNEERVAALRQLVTVQEDERQRIARDLHDQLGQQLTALRLKLEMLKKTCADNEDLSRQVGEAQKVARELDSDVDFLAWQLRPTTLDELGIVAALDNYVRQWSAHFNIPAEFNADRFGKTPLTREVETNLYRIAQEALNNAGKYARATRVNVFLEPRDAFAVLIIEDNGTGFDPGNQEARGTGRKGMGIVGMRERAALIGGKLEIESTGGTGTTVYVSVPLLFVRGEISND